MKKKFTEAPAHVMERAMEELGTVPDDGGMTTPPKTQTRGAAGKLAETLPQSLPIKGQKLMSAKRIRIRAGLERAGAEYGDAEFKELVESIRSSQGNIQPIDVRLLDGVPGFDAELLAGTRRLMASRELGLNVLANIRDCDDRMADRIHETENKHRKNKSPYSRGMQYKAMMDSGQYTTITDLSESILTRKQEISDALALIEKAPKGMWSKVTDAGALKTTQVRALRAAYDKPAFDKAVANESSLTVLQLVALANAALRPPPPKQRDTSVARLGRVKGEMVIMLPEKIEHEVAEGALEAARKYIESRRG